MLRLLNLQKKGGFFLGILAYSKVKIMTAEKNYEHKKVPKWNFSKD